MTAVQTACKDRRWRLTNFAPRLAPRPSRGVGAYSPDLNKAATFRLGLMLAEIAERTVFGPLGSQLGAVSDAEGS
jgi:hypothetical protein